MATLQLCVKIQAEQTTGYLTIKTGKENQMNIMKQLKDLLGGALGVVGMIGSLLRGGKERAAVAGRPAKGKGPGRKKPPPAAGKKVKAAPATRVKQASASVSVKGGKKSVVSKG
jgi:hypothetical protein